MQLFTVYMQILDQFYKITVKEMTDFSGIPRYKVIYTIELFLSSY